MKSSQKIILSSVIFILSLSMIFNLDPVNAVTYIHNYAALTSNGWDGNVLWSEKFTGLFPGLNVTNVGLNVTTTGSAHVRVKIFSNNDTIQTQSITHPNTGSEIISGGNGLQVQKFTGLPPGNKISSLGQMLYAGGFADARTKIFDNTGLLVGINKTAHTHISSHITSGGGGIYLQEFTGLPVGKTIIGADILTQGGGAFGCCTRLKVYSDSASTPVNLLGESNALTSSAKDYQAFISPFVVPSNGNVWAGFEGNYSTAYAGLGYDTGNMCTFGHTFGPGPSTAGTCSNISILFNMNLYTNNKNATFAGNLIGQSFTASHSGTAHQYSNFLVNATIPTDGTVWAGNEFSSTTNLEYAAVANQQYAISHTFGTGPNLVNLTTTDSDPVEAFALKLNYNETIGPNKLLGESSSLTVPSTGITTYPVNAKIPTDGKIWASFEADTNSMVLSLSPNLSSGSSVAVLHTYGTGPTVTSITPGSDQTFAPWMSITTQGPTLNVTPAIGTVGNTATLSGSNLGISNNLSFTFNGNALTTFPATVTTNSTGGFSGVTFTVPATSNGVKTINATNNAGLFANAFYSVNPSSFSINPTSGNVGDTESFNGTGFSELDTTTIKFDAKTVNTLSSDSIGSITGSFNIPSSTKGSHTIIATDTHGNNKTATFTTNTSMTINPTSGSSGKTITISGNGFASSSNVNIYFNNVLQTTSPATVTTNSTGSFSGVTFTVPASPVNTYIVKAVDASANQATQNFVLGQNVPSAPTLSALALSQTSVRFTSIPGSSSGDNPVIWYGVICQTNGGSWVTKISNSTLPNPRIYEISGLQPNDIVGCEWRDGSKSGWSAWSNEASTNTNLGLVQQPMGNNHLTSFIKWITDHGGVYFGFSVGPFIPLLFSLMATPKTVGIFAIITLMVMGVVHASGLFVYPAWYWGLMILFGIVLVLSRANEK